jgi:GntR family transcriptional regulator, rspAB operon transcriptional repressor
MNQGALVYEKLRDDIVEWRIPPGYVLHEVELTNQFKVSRTPVREALQRLAREGLVTTKRGRGTIVADISLDDTVELVQMREALETYAARLCARRRDRSVFLALRIELEECRRMLYANEVQDDYASYYDLITRFDNAITEGAGNHYLTSALRELRGHLYRLRRIARTRPLRMLATTDEHLAICIAICDGDEVAAVKQTSVHIQQSFQNMLDALMDDVVGLGIITPTPLLATDFVGNEAAESK